MKREPPSGAAIALRDNPLLREILDEMEAATMENLIYTRDEEERFRFAQRVQAIRGVWDDLNERAKGRISLKGKSDG